jgi:hypothetical protein
MRHLRAGRNPCFPWITRLGDVAERLKAAVC